MGSYSQDFPFGIMDVVELLHLRIRRRQADSAYTDCPFCGDRRGKMNVNFTKNVWRCNYCGEHGGMLNLYARVNNTTNSEAYQEICDALQAGDTSWGYGETENVNVRSDGPVKAPQTDILQETGIPQAERASPQEIHQTYSLLLGMLSLTPAHREHLRSEKRGLSDEQIDRLGFKSTPPYYLCQSITGKLIKQGCRVEGVPGFYLHENGCWTAKFSSRTAGILIPAIGIDGLIRGMQILLDVPFKDKDDPPEKAGTKYIWFSSSAKNRGVTSGSPVHFIGNPFARTIYVTEGILKADIAHVLLNRSFVAVAGANNTAQLGPLFGLLAQNGTELVIEAHDMDKYSNEMIAKGSSQIYLLARQHGMECRRLTWNPNYKGIDDWQLALRREKQQKEGEDRNLQESRVVFICQTGKGLADGLLNFPYRRCKFRIYQLSFDAGRATIPFAFKGIRDLRKAGYEQPPAAEYQLVWDSELACPEEWTDAEILGQILQQYGKQMPEGCKGRPLASSDVVELDDEKGRRYFYIDGGKFEPVRFSPFLAKKVKEECGQQQWHGMG